MRKYSSYIKLLAVFLLLGFLYSFSNKRNDKRMSSKSCQIEYLDDGGLFITRNSVNKLLIQNEDTTSSVSKEKLALNKMEKTLNANEMVRKADVYVSINGEVGAKILQRTPIVRVEGQQSFYVDSQGKEMSLSPVYSARVPLVTGSGIKKNLSELYELAKFIRGDEFLKKNVIGIHQEGDRFELKMRTEGFILKVGKVDNLESKFNNFKAFYQKGLHDKTLDQYKVVNLNFENQVVCTKK
ncbi:hypothetical protein OOZ15_10905 [Galbibacter sp. EGI 63066]|uniref:cell division protein FtsQ/DivIB n=1 Tax=Galbibacter sp. EGI 63066 TaxID=2993559 RepID=UPI00224936C2|nr:hypothetical protein [Galbibacter sp. EGI 63066]MCX2680451.1 hypothetical protein [Galbibacter sp. EGI 63066]